MANKSSRSISSEGGPRTAPARARLLGALILGVWALLSSSPARAATRFHAIVIGNNGGFVTGKDGSETQLPSLRYADDDAAAFYELISDVADVEFLTLMDTETQALYPSFAGRARVPTLEALRGAVLRQQNHIAKERAAGDRSVLFVFFSGHGSVDYEGRPALALADGGLDHDFLYRNILSALPADEVHLLIDACHAEAVVRPRDLEAETVSVSPAQANAFLLESTLARFPNVGAIVAASTNAKAHEWDAIRHGVFTHELLSALRGAADVNRDRRVEYSEVYAFMSAANRGIDDTRARLAIVAKPPDANRRTPLLRLDDFPREKRAWLIGVPGRHGVIEVDDLRGRRLATLHGDADFVADLLLPASSTLFLRSAGKETTFTVQGGDVVSFQALPFEEPHSRERGALDAAMSRGLFASAYGRRYYEGIVDQTPGFISVDFPARDTLGSRDESATSAAQRRYALVLGGGLSSGIADSVRATYGLNLGLRPGGDQGVSLSLALLTASDGALTERHYRVSAGYLWSSAPRALRASWGGTLGAGLLTQDVDTLPSRRAAFADAGPVVGVSLGLSSALALWSELELCGRLRRQDDRWVLGFAPSGWLGAALRL